MTNGLQSRLCALNCLNGIFEYHKPFDELFSNNIKKYKLSNEDQSFVHALCGFVLRYRKDLQKLITEYSASGQEVKPKSLNTILLLGLAQIKLMHVADHAAVDTSVELVKYIRHPEKSGFINAILRRALRENSEDLKPSLPSWLVQSWYDDYGEETARHIEQASLKQAKIGLSNKDGRWKAIENSTKLDLKNHEWVQDYASFLPVSLLDDVNGRSVLDLCAAPGGKTMQLAAKAANVTSVDISQRRLKTLKANLERTNLVKQVDIICADILKWKPQQKYDVVLLDAPCSATGTIRRHPDLPYIKHHKDIAALTDLQAKLLSRIQDWVMPGGLLVYCTCSLQKQEGEFQIDQFIATYKNFKRIKVDVVHNMQTLDGDIRILPSYGDMDGFFISLLKKSK